MNSIISLKNGATVNYMFTFNQYVLLFIGLVIVAFFSLYFVRKKFSYQRIFVLVVNIFLIVFEICRVIWRYFYLEYYMESLSFTNIVDLNFSTLCIWLTIIFSLVAFFIKRDKDRQVFGLSFVFNVASIVCFISLVYPTGLNSNFEFYHCYNLLFTLTRTFVILLGVSFACSGWFSVSEFADEWSGIFAILSFGVLCFVLGKLLGGNILYAEYLPLFEDVGVILPSPLHYFIIGMFFFIFQTIVYTPFCLYRFIKDKRGA